MTRGDHHLEQGADPSLSYYSGIVERGHNQQQLAESITMHIDIMAIGGPDTSPGQPSMSKAMLAELKAEPFVKPAHRRVLQQFRASHSTPTMRPSAGGCCTKHMVSGTLISFQRWRSKPGFDFPITSTKGNVCRS